MKARTFLLLMAVIFLGEAIGLVRYAIPGEEMRPDPVEINAAVQSVSRDMGRLSSHENVTSLRYSVIGTDGELLWAASPQVSKSINEAVLRRDLILDIPGEEGGKIIIDSGISRAMEESRKGTLTVIITSGILQLALFAVCFAYVNSRIIKPFERLKNFADNVAGGNLDIPLEMDRGNIFGAFTESFDIMRTELKKARIAEARANASKKELVAKLSHDIRTPVASIKAASEVGAAIAESKKIRENYTRIIHQADRINALVTNLFTAALEELQQLPVEPADMDSGEIYKMLESSDYMHRAAIPEVPRCLVYADKLRLQQVFDNIFSNSYKYAGTKIDVEISVNNGSLSVRLEDCGGGVKNEELPLLKEKFRRGSNSEGIEGAGLGLYISDCFMREMGGSLDIENGSSGLAAAVNIPMSGRI